MLYKPFKPPKLLQTVNDSVSFQQPQDSVAEPPTKKRKGSCEDDEGPEDVLRPLNKKLSIAVAPRKPLLQVRNPVAAEKPQAAGDNERYYSVLWRKFTTKKHKTWDGDGVLSVLDGYAHLQDISGKDLGKSPCSKPVLPGSELSVGGKEVEVDSVVSKEDFMAGKPFLGNVTKPAPKQPAPAPFKKLSTAAEPVPAVPHFSSNPRRTATGSSEEATPTAKLSKKARLKEEKIAATQLEPRKPTVTQSKAATGQFKTPLLNRTDIPKAINSGVPQPRHDPNQHNALVMKRPDSCPKNKQIVDVVVDPILGKHLRDHQREGVKFLYECVMGMRSGGEGAILADEMGLGKTLQTIALLWTLLKQNPIYQDPPVVKKALIVCPAGLTGNWRREFRKWLGNERIGVFVADNKKKRLADFTMGRSYNILIIGYEMLRSVQEDLKKGPGIDIVIADEGHRLKTANNKAMLAIQSLNTERRIILSGTPLQNDLSEFYTAIDFVNPGLLGKRTAFKREFETPIVKGRQPNATEKELEKGEARWQELVSLTSQFMIRRTADVLAKYLPPKTEHILFCKPTEAQASAYRSIISSPFFTAALGSTEMALQLITILKKVCNSPSLLSSKNPDDTPTDMLASLQELIPRNVLSSHASSAKIRVLDSLLHQVHTTTTEKVVIVSNYTSTLDMIERLLTSLSYSFIRMDGSTPASKRQALVERFNRVDAKTCFAFLLSAKAGGVGLNLIGASRLVLFDIDWNPATDLQAMARIHRDGQKRPCKIYRLLVQGALDEKIFQRQITKQGLADAVVDNKASAASFSREELRDLFRLDEKDHCQTHELLGCECGGKGNASADILDETSETLVIEQPPIGIEEETEDGFPGLLKASQMNMEEQEQKLKNKRQKSVDERPKLRALMQYHHIDTRSISSPSRKKADEDVEDVEEEEAETATLLEDEVLLDVLREQDRRIGFMFTRTVS